MFICYFTSNLQTLSNFGMTSLAVLVLYYDLALLTTARTHKSNLLFTCFQQVFGCSSPGDMSTNYHQPTPQMRSREYDAGLWDCRGPLLTVAGYIKGPASGRTISFYRPHNTRGVPLWPISESAQFKGPITVLPWNTLHRTGSKHYEFLWGNISQTSGSDEHFDGSQEGNSTKLPAPTHPPPPPTTCQYDSRKEPQKSGWRNEISLTKEKLFLVWH